MGTIGADQPLAEEEIHDVLRNERRREVLDHLRRTTGSTSLRDLAETIAEREAGESPPPTSIRESVYNSLHQTHLPRLDSEGIVVYDRDRKTVDLDRSARQVDPYMEVMSPFGVTWESFYRALCTVGLLLVLGSELEFPALAAVDTVLIVTLLLAAVAVSTGYQLWTNRWFLLRTLFE